MRAIVVKAAVDFLARIWNTISLAETAGIIGAGVGGSREAQGGEVRARRRERRAKGRGS